MLYKQAQDLFLTAIDTHIRLLRLDRTKHSATQETYEFAFDLIHDIGEKMESVGNPINKDDSAHEMIESLYEKVESMKENLSKEISKEKDLGVQNLLLTKLDGIQTVCAKLESLMDKGYMLTKALEEANNAETTIEN